MLKQMNKDMCYKVNVGPNIYRMVKEASEKVSSEPSPKKWQAGGKPGQLYSRQRMWLVSRSQGRIWNAPGKEIRSGVWI